MQEDGFFYVKLSIPQFIIRILNIIIIHIM